MATQRLTTKFPTPPILAMYIALNSQHPEQSCITIYKFNFKRTNNPTTHLY